MKFQLNKKITERCDAKKIYFWMEERQISKENGTKSNENMRNQQVLCV